MVQFGRKAKTVTNLSGDEVSDRVELISSFLFAAERYAPINYQCMRDVIAKCSYCKTPLVMQATVCQGCGQILLNEVTIRESAESGPAYPATIMASAHRALKKMAVMPECKINLSEIREQLTKIDLSAANAKLPGAYLVFKLAQLKNPKLAPRDAGLERYTREKMDAYDTTSWRRIAECNKFPYQASN